MTRPSFKPGVSTGPVSNIIYPSLETDTYFARISQINMIGTQKREYTEDGVTTTKFGVQHVILTTDLVDEMHEYVEGEGEKQVRLLNGGTWQKKVKNILYHAAPTYVNKVRTSDPLSMDKRNLLCRLAVAVGEPGFNDTDSDDWMELALLIDKPYQQTVEATKSGDKVYLHCREVAKLRKGDTPDPLLSPALMISHASVWEVGSDGEMTDIGFTPKVLKEIRYGIRLAFMAGKEYKGSELQKALTSTKDESGKIMDDGTGSYWVPEGDDFVKSVTQAKDAQQALADDTVEEPKTFEADDVPDDDVPF